METSLQLHANCANFSRYVLLADLEVQVGLSDEVPRQMTR